MFALLQYFNIYQYANIKLLNQLNNIQSLLLYYFYFKPMLFVTQEIVIRSFRRA